jgi:hypothetical protein
MTPSAPPVVSMRYCTWCSQVPPPRASRATVTEDPALTSWNSPPAARTHSREAGAPVPRTMSWYPVLADMRTVTDASRIDLVRPVSRCGVTPSTEPRGATRAISATCAMPDERPTWASSLWGIPKSTKRPISRRTRLNPRRAAPTEAPGLGVKTRPSTRHGPRQPPILSNTLSRNDLTAIIQA